VASFRASPKVFPAFFLVSIVRFNHFDIDRILSATAFDDMLRPEACVIYAGVEQSYAPVFVEGRAVPPAFEADSPLLGTLRGRRAPLALDNAGRQTEQSRLRDRRKHGEQIKRDVAPTALPLDHLQQASSAFATPPFLFFDLVSHVPPRWLLRGTRFAAGAIDEQKRIGSVRLVPLQGRHTELSPVARSRQGVRVETAGSFTGPFPPSVLRRSRLGLA
jgi:hypothetical protein